MLTGARIGELLGLQWKHVNFESRTLEIRQALWEGELVQRKTEASVRTIYFGPLLFDGFRAKKENFTRGEEAQVDYVTSPMVRDPQSGKYRRTRLFALTLGYSRKAVRLPTFRSSSGIWAELVRGKAGCPYFRIAIVGAPLRWFLRHRSGRLQQRAEMRLAR